MSEEQGHEPSQTFDQLFESLTGFEEIAISERFGVSIAKLAEHNETVFMRALVFTDMVREGMPLGDARKTAMGMPLGDVKDWCLDEAPDVMPDDPDSPAGKDDWQPESTPMTSPLSV